MGVPSWGVRTEGLAGAPPQAGEHDDDGHPWAIRRRVEVVNSSGDHVVDNTCFASAPAPLVGTEAGRRPHVCMLSCFLMLVVGSKHAESAGRLPYRRENESVRLQTFGIHRYSGWSTSRRLRFVTIFQMCFRSV